MDVLGNFMRECCEVKPHLRVKASDLYNAYIAWGGEKTITQNAFGRLLTERGFERYDKRWIVGLGLLSPD